MPQCRAKNRAGEQCRKPAMKGKRVCRAHGGASTGPKKANSARNAITHGIYTDSLSDDEKSLWGLIRLGDVDDELRLCRLRLRRALIAQRAAETGSEPAATELAEIKVSDEMQVVTRKRPDFWGIIERLLGRIGQLEKTRSELLASTSVTDPGQAAREVTDMLRAMVATELDGDMRQTDQSAQADQTGE